VPDGMSMVSAIFPPKKVLELKQGSGIKTCVVIQNICVEHW